MKKELIGILICTLLISVAVAPSTAVVPNIKNMVNNELTSNLDTNGRTIYVDDNNTEGPWDGTLEHPYQHIMDGINASSHLDTDTVYVFNGTYHEHVNVRGKLIGEDKNTTIIDGGGVGDVVKIIAYGNGKVIKGFTIKNSGWTPGLHYRAGIKVEIESTPFPLHYIIIKDNIISNNEHGIGLEIRCSGIRAAYGILITKNIITNNDDTGVYMAGEAFDGFKGNKITANYITNNHYGIYIGDYSHGNIIELNEIRDNGGEGIRISMFSGGNIFKKNNFINNGKNAFFYDTFWNIWRGNYWDDWGEGFHIIKGGFTDGCLPYVVIIPWINFDFHPAREPYDIPIEETQESIVSSYLETIASSSLQSDKQSKVAGDSPLAVSKSVVPSNSAQFQVSESNHIVNNNIKLNTPRYTSGPPFQIIYIGLISNKSAGGGAYYKFKCVNVINIAWDDDFACYFNHYTNGEKVWIPNYYTGIFTNHFVFIHFELC